MLGVPDSNLFSEAEDAAVQSAAFAPESKMDKGKHEPIKI